MRGRWVLLVGAVVAALAPTLVVGQTGQDFYAVTPCRLVDTRHGPKDVKEPGNLTPSGYPRGNFAAGEIRTYDLTLSTNCPGLPSGVGGQTMPSGESTLLGYPDRWTANSAIIPAGNDGDGSFNVAVQNAGDVIVEIDGYFK